MARTRSPVTPRFQITALIFATVIAAVLYGIVSMGGNSGGAPTDTADTAPVRDLAPYATGAMANFVPAETPLPLAEITFTDGAGRGLTLDDFTGRTVLLNLWATWCAPCREEMPALDALQARVQAQAAGDDFTVLALSLDRGGIDKPRAFLDEIGIQHLALYHDASGRMGMQLGAFGLPTTLLIGPDGHSLGRLVGPAHWDAPEALALIQAARAHPTHTRPALGG